VNEKSKRPATQADVQSWQARMRAVVLDTIDEGEIREILRAVMAEAKKGDLQAARLILSYAVGNSATQASAVPAPTAARGGSREKLDVLAWRHANGLPLHENGDGGPVDLS